MPDTDLRREDQIDERANAMFNSHPDLQDMERNAGASSVGDEAERYASSIKSDSDSKSANNTNISATKDQEEASGWKNNYIGKGTNQTTNIKGSLKKKGPAGAIITLLLGGGFIGSGFIGTAFGLVHIGETVKNKVDTMSSAVQKEAEKVMDKRLTGAVLLNSGKCSGMVRVRCKFNTFSQTQLNTFKEKGIRVINTDGSEVKAGEKPGRNARLVTPDFPEGIKASEFSRQIQSNPTLRNNFRDVFPTKRIVWKDKIGSTYAKAKRITTNPKWTSKDQGGTAEETRKDINKNLQQVETGGSGNEATGDTQNISDAVDEEKQKITNQIDEGKPVKPLSTSLSDISRLPAPQVSTFSKFKNFTLDAANPLSILTSSCMAYNYGRIIVTAAKLAGKTEEMRFAGNLVATSEKLKAGDATPNDVSSSMNILSKLNSNGDNFSDSAGYHYAAYNKVTDTPIESGATGSPFLTAVSNSIGLMDSILNPIINSPLFWASGLGAYFTLRGDTSLKDVCQRLVSAEGIVVSIGIGVLINILSAGTASVVTEAGTVGAKTAGQKILTTLTKKWVEKTSSKAALKNAGKDFIKAARKPAGFFLISYMTARYAIPYLAHIATGTILSADSNGVAAMDSVVSGMGSMNGGTAQARGMTVMSPDQAIAYLQFNNQATATYIADMRQQANPFNLNDPYSISNNVAFSLTSFLSNMDFIKNPSSLLTMPSHILSAVTSPSLFSGTASAATNSADTKALMNECQDSDATQRGTIATDPFCNPIYGFSDMNALKNSDPDEVVKFMYDNNYINDDGEPIGDYASYSQTCFTGASDKVISTLTISSDLDKKCYSEKDSGLNHETYVKFHIYQIDKAVVDQMDNPYDPTQDSGDTTTTGNVYSDTSNLKSDEDWYKADLSNIQCAAGSQDLGVTSDGGYLLAGVKYGQKIRICAVDAIPQEGDAVPGAKGRVVVNSGVSKNWVDLGKAAKEAGISLKSNSSFRSWSSQCELITQRQLGSCTPGELNSSCTSSGCGTAPVGYSDHGMGYAIDFQEMSTGGLNLCSPDRTPEYKWMRKNSRTFGLGGNWQESWHFDVGFFYKNASNDLSKCPASARGGF